MSDVSRPTIDAASNGGGVSSPQSRRRSLTSAWASVVRGDSEHGSSPTSASAAAASRECSSTPPRTEQTSASENPVIEIPGSETQPETPDGNGDSNAGQQKKPAWKKSVNGVVEPASVMGGAVSWPALSETTRPVHRSLHDSPKPIPDGSSSSSQAHIISPPPQRPANNNVHAHSTANHPPTRHRSRNRNGGGGGGGVGGGGTGGVGGGGAGAGGVGGGGGGGDGVEVSLSGQSQPAFNQPSLPMPPPFPVFEIPYGMVPAVMDTSVRGPRPVGGTQSHPGNSHSNQRGNNFRRGSYGSRPRGDGHYHSNYGGRRDQDRREVHHPPQYVPPPMGYMPAPLPPGAATFMAPPSMRIFPGQMGFDMTSPFIYVQPMPLESFRAMPFVPSPPPMLFSPTNESSLVNMIVKQIDFYFSDDNLVKDNYLRSNMDDHGWVPIALIASFRRVQQLTKDIPVVLDSLRYSTVVEIQGEKVRRRNEWSKWVHSSGRRNLDSGTIASSSACESALASSLQVITLDDNPVNADGGKTNKLSGQVGLVNVEKVGDEGHSNYV